MSGRPGWGKIVALLAKGVLSIGLLAFLVQRVRWDQVSATLARADESWMTAAIGLMLLSNVIGSWQWSQLLRVVDIRIPFWKVCTYYHVGLFFNNLLPANIGGDFFRVADAARYGATRTAALSAVLMDRLVNTLALGGLALLTTLPALDRFHLWMIYLALVVFSAVSVIMLWAVFHPGLLPMIERLLGKVGLGRLSPHLDELAVHLAGYREKPRLFFFMFLVAVITQISRVGVHVLVAHALGLHVPLVYFFLFVPLLAVVVSLPISFNGIGVREGAGILVFGLVGVNRAEAFSLQFTTYLVAVAVSLLGGIAFLARMPSRRAQARDSRRSAG